MKLSRQVLLSVVVLWLYAPYSRAAEPIVPELPVDAVAASQAAQRAAARGVVAPGAQMRKFLAVEDATLQAVERWQQTGRARPIVGDDGTVLFPFGQYQPRIVCAPDRVCDIALEPGEKVVGAPSVGKNALWTILPAESGVGDKKRVHIAAIPHDVNQETNLIVRTDRRTYHMMLASRADGEYMSQVGFYYPVDMMNAWTVKLEADKEREKAAAAAGAGFGAGMVASAGAGAGTGAGKGRGDDAPKRKKDDVDELNVDLVKVDRAYTVKGGEELTRPVSVFNDGAKTYIQLPFLVRVMEMPVFVVVGKDGKTMLTNFRTVDSAGGSWLIVDRLFDKGALLTGADGEDGRVDIVWKNGPGNKSRGWNPFAFGG